jgi:hypothetical protein
VLHPSVLLDPIVDVQDIIGNQSVEIADVSELLYAPTYRLVELGINKLDRSGQVDVELKLYRKRNK